MFLLMTGFELRTSRFESAALPTEPTPMPSRIESFSHLYCLLNFAKSGHTESKERLYQGTKKQVTTIRENNHRWGKYHCTADLQSYKFAVNWFTHKNITCVILWSVPFFLNCRPAVQ